MKTAAVKKLEEEIVGNITSDNSILGETLNEGMDFETYYKDAMAQICLGSNKKKHC